MNRAITLIAVLAIGVLFGVAGGYWYATRHAPAPLSDSKQQAAGGDRKVLYWYDPMYPQQRFDKPGKSPYMDMQLVPKYPDEKAEDGGVSVSSRVVQNLGVRTAEVTVRPLASQLTAVGTVEYDERSFVVVQPRVGGYIERLFVRAPLDPVSQGQPLVEMLLPDWASAQEEFLMLRKRDDTQLANAARQRLVLLGMSEEQISTIERTGTPQTRIVVRAPAGGVVAELGARQGMTVSAGTTLFRIASLGSVWVVAEIPEVQSSQLLPGSRAEVRLAAYPNEKFSGRVGALLPEVNATTRTVRARIEVNNPGMKLKPGMYANVNFTPQAREALIVPSEAVIRTGSRDVVILARGDGQFRPVEVEVGMETNDGSEIRKGLEAGDRVVVSGQFLIDSEASLRTALDRLQGAQPASPGTAEPSRHRGSGKVTAVDAASGRVELDHRAMPSLKWPAMTMGFAVEDKSQLANIRKGDAVEFELAGKPNEEGDYVVTRIVPAGAKK